MKVILKPAGWISALGIIGVLAAVIISLSQQASLKKMPELPPTEAFRSLKVSATADPLFDDPDKMKAVNLTQIGTVDWVRFAGQQLAPSDEKVGHASVIGKVELVPARAKMLPAGAQGPSRAIVWSDGARKKATEITYGGIHVGPDSGFRFSVPTAAQERTLYVLVGGYKAEGGFTAFQSDGNAPTISKDEIALGKGYYSRIYRVRYSSPAPGQSLTVVWRMAGGQGNVSLQAIALSESGGKAVGH